MLLLYAVSVLNARPQSERVMPRPSEIDAKRHRFAPRGEVLSGVGTGENAVNSKSSGCQEAIVPCRKAVWVNIMWCKNSDLRNPIYSSLTKGRYDDGS